MKIIELPIMIRAVIASTPNLCYILGRAQLGLSRWLTAYRPHSPPPTAHRASKSEGNPNRCAGPYPSAQPPLRRPHAVAGGYPDDARDHRHRYSARDFRARPHHRRQERACELEGDAADLSDMAHALIRCLRLRSDEDLPDGPNQKRPSRDGHRNDAGHPRRKRESRGLGHGGRLQ